MKKFYKKLLAGIVLMLVITVTVIPAAANDDPDLEDNAGTVYYFWGYCPTCSKPEEHVDLFDDYPVEVEVYEVFQDEEGRKKYEQISEEVSIEVRGFPTLVYQDQFWLGFSEAVQEDIIDAIEASMEEGEAADRREVLDIPIIGEVDLSASPILLSTFIIAFLDGFNPCSLFVLTFLLAIIIHSASRKRIFLVGLTFLLVTSVVYGLFIMGILNIMVFVAQLFWISYVVAAIVIILGLVAIKDYFLLKEGLTFSIPEQYKSRYYQQVRKVFYTKSVIPMIFTTAVMALGIALVELPCTAGFPFIWSSLMAELDLGFTYFIILFVVYLLTYLSVELIIFLIAVIRLRSIKMTAERGRLLKLIAGSLMLVLGLILLVDPTYMENMIGILFAFGATAILALILFYTRKFYENRGGY
ncbi:MAG: hypothetical protein ACQES4_10530 [Bacillota bacterium]